MQQVSSGYLSNLERSLLFSESDVEKGSLTLVSAVDGFKLVGDGACLAIFGLRNIGDLLLPVS